MNTDGPPGARQSPRTPRRKDLQSRTVPPRPHPAAHREGENKVNVPLAYRPAEAARACGVGRTTLYAWLNEGRIASVTVGRARLIPVAEIERFLSSQLTCQPPRPDQAMQNGGTGSPVNAVAGASAPR